MRQTDRQTDMGRETDKQKQTETQTDRENKSYHNERNKARKQTIVIIKYSTQKDY